jgi:drug/metabolite transporter (DMT)-like permease
MEIKKILLVFSTVLVTLFTAVLLNYGAKQSSLISFIGLVIVSMVIVINVLKFVVWGKINKKYDLSESYPLTSLFFPLIYLVAIYNEEAQFQISKIIGVFFIFIGIWIMNKKKSEI